MMRDRHAAHHFTIVRRPIAPTRRNQQHRRAIA